MQIVYIFQHIPELSINIKDHRTATPHHSVISGPTFFVALVANFIFDSCVNFSYIFDGAATLGI